MNIFAQPVVLHRKRPAIHSKPRSTDSKIWKKFFKNYLKNRDLWLPCLIFKVENLPNPKLNQCTLLPRLNARQFIQSSLQYVKNWNFWICLQVLAKYSKSVALNPLLLLKQRFEMPADISPRELPSEHFHFPSAAMECVLDGYQAFSIILPRLQMLALRKFSPRNHER